LQWFTHSLLNKNKHNNNIFYRHIWYVYIIFIILYLYNITGDDDKLPMYIIIYNITLQHDDGDSAWWQLWVQINFQLHNIIIVVIKLYLSRHFSFSLS